MNTLDLEEVLLEALGNLIPEAVDLINDPKRKGGYLCVTMPTGTPLCVLIVGEVEPEEKAQKYFEFCQEKAKRLAANAGHVSSWQSRDESQNRYGGAIRTGKFILSFSGFPEDWDEACMVVAAQQCGFEINLPLIKKISGNTKIELLEKQITGA
jgi:hypothetical protein